MESILRRLDIFIPNPKPFFVIVNSLFPVLFALLNRFMMNCTVRSLFLLPLHIGNSGILCNHLIQCPREYLLTQVFTFNSNSVTLKFDQSDVEREALLRIYSGYQVSMLLCPQSTHSLNVG